MERKQDKKRVTLIAENSDDMEVLLHTSISALREKYDVPPASELALDTGGKKISVYTLMAGLGSFSAHEEARKPR